MRSAHACGSHGSRLVAAATSGGANRAFCHQSWCGKVVNPQQYDYDNNKHAACHANYGADQAIDEAQPDRAHGGESVQPSSAPTMTTTTKISANAIR